MSTGRVLLISFDFSSAGGLEIYTRETAFALRESGVEVDVVCPRLPRGQPDESGVRVFGLMPKNRLARRAARRLTPYLLQAFCALRKRNYDRIILGHVGLAKLARPLLDATTCPYWVLTFGIEVWEAWNEPVRTAMAGAERIVTISSFSEEQIESRLVDGRRRMSLIAPHVDLSRFVDTPSSSADESTQTELRLLTVARLSSAEGYKGHDLVLEALAHLKGIPLPPLRYQIAGAGDDSNRLQKLAKDLGLQDIVEFLGRVSDDELVSLYQGCDIYVMPSYVRRRPDGTWAGEGFGIVYIEAAACAKPSVGCDEGGQTDIIQDGKTGMLVKPEAKDVARALRKLASDATLRQKMGQAAKADVHRFQRRAFVEAWAKLWTSCLAGSHQPPPR
jgi:phosphatidyl-myo-inositol dimannoside synthase